jgi:hypothetical protein
MRVAQLGLGALAVATTAITVGCASASQPPGAPERHTPPAVVSTSADSGATNVKLRAFEFRFDEVVSDRPSGTATNLDQLFLISPRDGSPDVGWHRNRITVRPRRGFRPNTAYRITMLPGLADLRGNVKKDGLSILFSTGPTFPPHGILGRAFDWAQERPASGAYIEAISRADTTLVYVTASDTTGMFELGPLDSGTYLVRGLIDQNSNRAVDVREKWDTTTVQVVDARIPIELDLIERDSTPANLTNSAPEDSVTLRLGFDKAISPTVDLQPSLFRIQRSDSTPLVIDRVEWFSTYSRAKAAADSIRRANDTTRTDTTRRVPAQPAGGLPGLTPRGAPPPPKPRVPAPETGIVIHLSPSTPMTPGRYAITVRGLSNLRGNATELRRVFTVAPPQPRDTTRRPPPRRVRFH